MAAFARRLALLPLTLLGVTLVTFLLAARLPGDAATQQLALSRGASPAALARLRHDLELDRPLGPRYLTWLGRSLRLDFGASLVDGVAVRARLGAALPATLALALLGWLVALGLALPLGAAAAACDRRPLGRALAALAQLGYALPVAALGLWAIGAGAPYGGVGLAGLLAPAACLAVAAAVRLGRYQRDALVAALAAGYVVTARAKGLGRVAVLRHALANTLLPMVTLAGAELPALLSATVIVEPIFGVRGLGLLAVDAVLARDVPLLLGLTTVGALVTIAAVLAADVAAAVSDPRLRERAL